MTPGDPTQARPRSLPPRTGKLLAIVASSIPFAAYRLWAEWSRLRPLTVLANILAPLLLVMVAVLVSPALWRKADRRKGPWSFPAVLLLNAGIIAACLAGIGGLDWLLFKRAGRPYPFLEVYLNDLALFLPIIVLVGRLLSKYRLLDSENLMIREQARQAQSRALQAQMHPHALFNALNDLAELIHKDPAAAEASVRHLSDFFRRVLKASDLERYTLGEERTLLQDYLDIEQLRLGERLRVTWEWDAGQDREPIPPLLLQPLVENALKHGIAPALEGGELRLVARRRADHLELGVHNTGEAPRRGMVRGTGLGVRNLRARLQLLFGGRATFELVREEAWTEARIRLPLGSPGAATAGE